MAYDPIEITKNLIFGTATPSEDYNLHIRPNPSTPPESVTYNMLEYMTTGGGRFALPSLFSVIEKFFSAQNLADGQYTYAQLSSLLGLTAADIKARRMW